MIEAIEIVNDDSMSTIEKQKSDLFTMLVNILWKVNAATHLMWILQLLNSIQEQLKTDQHKMEILLGSKTNGQEYSVLGLLPNRCSQESKHLKWEKNYCVSVLNFINQNVLEKKKV